MYMVNNLDLKIDKKEAMRYLRVAKSDEVTDALANECIKEIYKIASPKAVYLESSIEFLDDDMVKLDFMTVKSHSLTVNLNKCKKVVVFAATLGIEVDRAIEKYSKILQSKASMYHAVGSALIESFCNYVNDAVTENVRKSTRRFSPGYGDLPLECQKDVLRALDAERKIGIILSDSLLMSPSKSVTAIIGIK
jgi:hypothetical protein